MTSTTPPPPQPFYGPFSGTTRVSRCQKRTSGLYGARGFNRGRYTDHPAGHHSIRTNQCPPPSSPMIMTSSCEQINYSDVCKVDASRIDAVDQWCLRTLLGIRWHQFVCNEEVRRITKQPDLTAIIQSRRLSMFGHIAHMDDDADAKMILTAPLPENWKRSPGRPRITWLNTIQRDLRAYNLTLNEAVDLAQNRPLWRLMSTYGATHS